MPECVLARHAHHMRPQGKTRIGVSHPERRLGTGAIPAKSKKALAKSSSGTMTRVQRICLQAKRPLRRVLRQSLKLGLAVSLACLLTFNRSR